MEIIKKRKINMTLFFFPLSQIVVPLLLNNRNQSKWTQALSQDMGHHVHALRTNVFVVSGQVEGKTLLAPPAGSERMEQAAIEIDQRWHLRHEPFTFTNVLVISMTYVFRGMSLTLLSFTEWRWTRALSTLWSQQWLSGVIRFIES